MKCEHCGQEVTVLKFNKPFRLKERKASTAIVDATDEVMVSYASQYGRPEMTGPNKIKANYVLAALNAYEPPEEAADGP